MSEVKKVLEVYGPGSNHWVGDGFPVRNMFPSNGLREEIDPFLMLDYAGPSYFEPSQQSHGVGEHPHRGFETVTIAYQGAVSHRDSAGNAGIIFPGDVQWMTAAAGIVHEEMHEQEFAKNGGTFEMIQLWVNLPKAVKMSKPRYQGITKEQIPTVDLGNGSYARVIAGELGGARGPASTFTPVNLFDVRLTAGSKVELPIPEGHNTGVFVLKGNIALNGGDSLKGEARIATVSPEGESVLIEAKEDSTLLILSGEPINEPVFSYGRFVMNTRDEIMQAVHDYNDGKMGHLR
ncbi:pirin family protein [Alloacidobacterium dinghuense]|uniref:Pirin family protein n=1 Tax=Alloacidobacterium dinghuense TaxID=2763107 RepID=A0A7G8BKQ9_9BACT|nr:pirin family protein [Alloacidobacterium dinghuense]QNI33129.1 pirin family protein [Alloacidobacterium dinghuense]